MVKIRLSRHGAKKAPYYRIVVTDSRNPRDGRSLEEIGRYNPRTEPITVEVKLDRYDAWIAQGAQATDTVVRLVKVARERQAAE